jgi:hypothetical protein
MNIGQTLSGAITEFWDMHLESGEAEASPLLFY